MSEHHCPKCRYFGEGDWSQCEDCERLDHIDALEKSREEFLLRIAALESLVRAADRMKHYVNHTPGCNESLLIGPCDCRLTGAMDAYDTQRAAVGEIEEE